jgi:hypothetical protein
MTPTPLDHAFDRAERALIRLRRAVERADFNRTERSRDSALRARVVEVVAELDSMIQDAGGPR